MLPLNDSFVLVYQGGHHDVFCDGSKHVRAYGGKCGWEPAFIDEFLCDCEKWKAECSH